MSTTTKYLLGSVASLMTTELDSLAAGGQAVATSAFDNTVGGGGGDGYLMGDLELAIAGMAAAPLADPVVQLWFLMTTDGTNYEDGSSTVIPHRPADVAFPLRAVATAQRVIRRATLPWGKWKVLLRLNGNQALSTGNTLKVRPATPESV